MTYRIFLHCTAGYGNIQAIKNYWKNVLGWKSNGYHIIIDLDGGENQITEFGKIVNGVRGYNTNSIHISYIGGVSRTNYKIAEDTRTEAQKAGILNAIFQAIQWIELNHATAKIEILGHRDISKDVNGNGIIDTWERIKECPSFDAIPEYKWIILNQNNS
ncbi:N-acetylmuramoyl-L-alanine amidase [Belliella sp. DSM 107340]|uniref:N-acetylmuramoyl-L-alanine amidase n=1 Tax=Belliella calami TaxID=2923436 RepID=A0ABS9UIX0_9BACT|nr:N-acetylmuramoyl-L-alanine amidase [Belliella calami]MCH7396572.1 N-acetylmuramoyl-L-alanine amidase [Belliella calami]